MTESGGESVVRRRSLFNDDRNERAILLYVKRSRDRLDVYPR